MNMHYTVHTYYCGDCIIMINYLIFISLWKKIKAFLLRLVLFEQQSAHIIKIFHVTNHMKN